MLLSEIAKAIGGELKGESNPDITSCAGIGSAGKGKIIFIASAKQLAFLKSCSASAVITGRGLDVGLPSIEVDNAVISFSKVIDILHPEPEPRHGVHPTAVIDSSAKIDETVSIGANSTVGAFVVIGKGSLLRQSVHIGDGCVIGEDCVIHPQTAIINGASVGDRVVVQCGTVIGCDGFKYEKNSDGDNIKIRHAGIVRVGNDVEIGANCSIDRAFIDETVIEDGVKLDNLVHIAHNVKIGERSLIAGQFGIAGSSEIGKGVMTGGQVGVADHIKVPDGTILAAKSGVAGTIKEAGIYAGNPAVPISNWRKVYAASQRLPEIVKKVRKLEKGNKGD